jgi:hypothetical protein
MEKLELKPTINKAQVCKTLINFTDSTDDYKLHKQAYMVFHQFFGYLKEKSKELTRILLGNKYNEATYISAAKAIDAKFDEDKTSNMNIYCFDFIKSRIAQENLYYSNKSVDISEIQYYLYRITKHLMKSNGYQQVARNYFLSNGFKAEYKAKTKRKLFKEKLAHLNKVLSKYNLINCYNQKKKTTLFVIGTSNPFINMKGILEDPKEVERLIKKNNMFDANVSIQEHKLKTENKKLREKLEEKTKQTDESGDVNPEDYKYLCDRFLTLLEEKKQLEDYVEKLNNRKVFPIHRPFDFEEKFNRLLVG